MNVDWKQLAVEGSFPVRRRAYYITRSAKTTTRVLGFEDSCAQHPSDSCPQDMRPIQRCRGIGTHAPALFEIADDSLPNFSSSKNSNPNQESRSRRFVDVEAPTGVPGGGNGGTEATRTGRPSGGHWTIFDTVGCLSTHVQKRSLFTSSITSICQKASSGVFTKDINPAGIHASFQTMEYPPLQSAQSSNDD